MYLSQIVESFLLCVSTGIAQVFQMGWPFDRKKWVIDLVKCIEINCFHKKIIKWISHTPESVPFIRSNVNKMVDIENCSKCTHMDYLNIFIELSICFVFLACLHRSNTLGTIDMFEIRQIGSYWFILKSNLLFLLSGFDSMFLRISARPHWLFIQNVNDGTSFLLNCSSFDRIFSNRNLI